MRLRKGLLKRKRPLRKPPLLRRRCPRWYSGPLSLALSRNPLFHFRENCCPPGVPPVVRRWNKPISVPLVFHLGPAKSDEVEHPQSLAPSQKSESVPLWPSKNNIPPHPRATAPLWPCVGFSRAGRKPASPGQRRQRRSALREKEEHPVPVNLNAVKNPFFPHRMKPTVILLRFLPGSRRGKQSRRLSTACRRAPGGSPDPLLFTKRRDEMKRKSLTNQKIFHRKETQYV